MKKIHLFLVFFLLLALSGCKAGPEFGDAVYMTGTLTSNTIRFLVDGSSSALGLTVTSTTKVDGDVKIKLQSAPQLLDGFNASTSRECQLPPEDSYTIQGSEVLIENGKNVSTQIAIYADSEKLKEGVSYCIPISITSVEGDGLKVLEASRTAYVMLTKVVTVKVAYLKKAGCFDIPSFVGENSPVKALDQMTLEMKVCPKSFTEGQISSLCGCEENFLFRFGDGAGNPSNKLQLSKGSIGTASHPDSKDHYEFWVEREFTTDQWIHFAAVYDGQYLRVYLDGEQISFVETNGGQINLSMSYNGQKWTAPFSIGSSVGHNRFFDGYVSECRVWNIARTSAQIADAVCYVDPTTPGLVAYWRFDGEQENGGVLDLTGHGHDAQKFGKIEWVDNQKCPF